ncbi:MAG: hypothetical protein LBB65_03615 [Burkholderiales bacterium]|nr:hypothetical protein [Burkholderiales bacterium]
MTQKTETLESTTTVQTYEYDIAGRLIEIKAGEAGQETTETWGYDANGNRTHHNGEQIATFDAQDRILLQNSASYQHNLLGQRTKKNQLGQITAFVSADIVIAYTLNAIFLDKK